MQSRDALQAGRLAVLEGAVLSLLRCAQDDGFDGLKVDVSADEGTVTIDVQYTVNGVPLAGESL